MTPANRFIPRPGCGSPPSADLVGRAVAISGDIPTFFDTPLARHHRLIGSWIAARDASAVRYTCPQVRRHIERVFDAAVLGILEPVELADLRVTVLRGDDDRPPALVITCESMGQLDLGWIEDSDAPIPWRAAAYAALDTMLGRVLPVFGYRDLFEEIARWYCEGETDDAAAREVLTECHGADAEDLESQPLPSTMNARRPAWMIAANAAPPARLPIRLRRVLAALRRAHEAVERIPPACDAWHVDHQRLVEHLPEFEECSHLPAVTLVPFEHFACEIDDMCRHGMEVGFTDVAGFHPLAHADRIDDWFASLRLGARFLCAVQDLIRFDPASS